MDALTPNDLDQLSKVITQALQVVDDVKGVKGREVVADGEVEMKREPLGKTSGEELEPEGTFHQHFLQHGWVSGMEINVPFY